ncbi:hypothetical protein EXW38_11480 [Bacillus mycoides]|uniref:hypothetical protein n=1 Tax=Bacillus mycoides TaxID=1405 RepID=UPI001C011EE3|nr:hypothetical protein [Bacillus mycoides]QWH11946.1 hypothetical protein EXW38_11480 [Bacillus mycoides]
MIDKEREKMFKKAFSFVQRSMKRPLYDSYTRGYTRGYSDKEPAQKAYDYLVQLKEDTSYNFEEKLDIFYSFLEKEYKNNEGYSYYNQFLIYIPETKKQIENGEPIQTRRK